MDTLSVVGMLVKIVGALEDDVCVTVGEVESSAGEGCKEGICEGISDGWSEGTNVEVRVGAFVGVRVGV